MFGRSLLTWLFFVLVWGGMISEASASDFVTSFVAKDFMLAFARYFSSSPLLLLFYLGYVVMACVIPKIREYFYEEKKLFYVNGGIFVFVGSLVVGVSLGLHWIVFLIKEAVGTPFELGFFSFIFRMIGIFVGIILAIIDFLIFQPIAIVGGNVIFIVFLVILPAIILHTLVFFYRSVCTPSSRASNKGGARKRGCRGDGWKKNHRRNVHFQGRGISR